MSKSLSTSDNYTLSEEIFNLVDALRDLDCPLLGSEERPWLEELLLNPGLNRLRLLQWIYTLMFPDWKPKFELSISEECLNETISAFNSLGACKLKDIDLITGEAPLEQQMTFWKRVLKICQAMVSKQVSSKEHGSETGKLLNAIIHQSDFKTLLSPSVNFFSPDMEHYFTTADCDDGANLEALIQKCQDLRDNNLLHSNKKTNFTAKWEQERKELDEQLMVALKDMKVSMDNSKIKDLDLSLMPSFSKEELHSPLEASLVEQTTQHISSLSQTLEAFKTVTSTYGQLKKTSSISESSNVSLKVLEDVNTQLQEFLQVP